MSRYQKKHEAEMQWLETGIEFLAVSVFYCIKVFVLGLVQLSRYLLR